MNDLITDITAFIARYANWLTMLKVLAQTLYYIGLYGIWQYYKRYRYRDVRLSIGSFRVRNKHFTVQNVTNIVSATFYDGGHVPEDIRKEILLLTIPKIKDLKMANTSDYDNTPNEK